MTTTITDVVEPQAPTWNKPTEQEKNDRQLLVRLMRDKFVLDGRKQLEPVRFTLDNMTAPDLPLNEDDPESPMIPVTRLHGAARAYLGIIVRAYGWVGSNDTTTAEQSAINRARNDIVQRQVRSGVTLEEAWKRVETRDDVLETWGRDEHPVAQAFSLAMVFWHHATRELSAFIKANKGTPELDIIRESLRVKYERKPW